MSHKSFSRILTDQSNKLLLGGNTNQLIEQNMDKLSTNLLSDKKVSEINPISSNYYNIFGYELSFITIVIILILTICVAYFLYKYFFTKTDIVHLKKYSDVKKKLDDNQSNNKKKDVKNEENEETENSQSSKNSELSSSNKTNNSSK
jgi:hypothetical protein